MKRTQFKNAIRTVWESKVSWLAISVVVMICCGIYFGTLFYADSLEEKLYEYADSSKMEDFNILATQGLKEDEIEDLKDIDGILDAEGTWRLGDSGLVFNGEESEVDIYGLTERISLADTIEGELPDEDGECALTKHVAEECGISTGDTVELSYGDDFPDDFIKSDSFTVTAIVRHPDCLSDESGDVVLLAKDAFDKDAVDDNYSCIRVDADLAFDSSVGLQGYSDSVNETREKVKENLESIGYAHDEDTREEAQKELDDTKEEADEELAKARKKIKNADDKIESGKKKIDAADKKLSSAKKKVSSGENSLSKNEKKLKKAKKTVNASEKKLKDAESQLVDAKKQIDKAEEELKQKQDELEEMEKKGETPPQELIDQIEAAEKELKEKKEEYNASKQKVAEGKKKLQSKKKQLHKAEKKLKKARKQLTSVKSQLSSASGTLSSSKSKLANAKQELEESKKEYRDKEEETDEKIADAQAEIDDLPESGYVFLTRDDMDGYVMMKEDIRIIKMLGLIFFLIFAFVAVIVILSTITIIIDGSKKLIGTMKAFGFKSSEIIKGYLIFGVSASCFGMLLSIALALFMQLVIGWKLSPMFVIRPATFSFEWGTYVVLLLLQLAIAAVVTIIGTMFNATRHSAVALLNGQTGKKTITSKTRTKKGGSLYARLIRRNMRTDLARVLVSILIIAGSCLMMGDGMTLRDAFSNMMDLSAKYITHYDMEIDVTDRSEDGTFEDVKDYLSEKDLEFAEVCRTTTVYHYGDAESFVNVISGDNGIYPDYIEATDMKGKAAYSPAEDGILVTNRISEDTGLESGTEFEIYDEGYHPQTAQAGKIYKNYYGSNLYLSEDDYESIIGSAPENNTFLVRMDDDDRDAYKEELQEEFRGLDISYTDELPDTYSGLEDVYNIIVYIVLGLSILMSLFVLLNLVNIYVSRRRNEIIIMSVNGFTWKEQRGYLMKESIVTIAAGLFFGVVIGFGMTDFLVRCVEYDNVMFVRNFDMLAWIFAIIVELLFALAINVISYRQLQKLKLTDITK